MDITNVIKSISDKSTEGIILFTAEYCCELWNKSMEQITGISKEKALGKFVYELFPNLCESEPDLIIHKASMNVKVDFSLIDPKYSNRDEPNILQLQFTPYYNNKNEIAGVIANVHTTSIITDEFNIQNTESQKTEKFRRENKQLELLCNKMHNDLKNITETLKETTQKLKKSEEKALESDRLKDSFIQNFSHEIRTPLNAIIGFSQLFNDPKREQASLKHYAQIISDEGDKLLATIDKVIEVSMLETKQTLLNKRTFHLKQFFNELDILFNETLKRSGKSFLQTNYTIPKNVSLPTLKTDIHKLRQTFLYLFQNALQFTSTGSVNYGIVEITSESVVFFVADTGIGIPNDKLDEIFIKFNQAYPEGSLPSGLGLGLTVAKGFVELMKGKIWVKSEANRGSVFYFSIPYNKNISHRSHPMLARKATIKIEGKPGLLFTAQNR